MLDSEELLRDAQSVILRHFPSLEITFRQLGWYLPQSIDRVYAIDKAVERLGYQPDFNFEEFMAEISRSKGLWSEGDL